MVETSRLSTTARALGDALEALADALAQARPDVVAASESEIDQRTRDFRAAADDAIATGDALPPDAAFRVAAALRRCRRLGCSLSLLAGPYASAVTTPSGYSPVGQPLPMAGEGAFLTARG